jgi:hypothetical protein
MAQNAQRMGSGLAQGGCRDLARRRSLRVLAACMWRVRRL